MHPGKVNDRLIFVFGLTILTDSYLQVKHERRCDEEDDRIDNQQLKVLICNGECIVFLLPKFSLKFFDINRSNDCCNYKDSQNNNMTYTQMKMSENFLNLILLNLNHQTCIQTY